MGWPRGVTYEADFSIQWEATNRKYFADRDYNVAYEKQLKLSAERSATVDWHVFLLFLFGCTFGRRLLASSPLSTVGKGS